MIKVGFWSQCIFSRVRGFEGCRLVKKLETVLGTNLLDICENIKIDYLFRTCKDKTKRGIL